MKEKARPADIYLRFLRLAEALKGMPSLPPLDPLEERILALVARSSQEKTRLSVKDMMAIDTLGSPATVHARLTSMRKKGWIALADTEDARRKQVEPTQEALRYFDRLSSALVQAVESDK